MTYNLANIKFPKLVSIAQALHPQGQSGIAKLVDRENTTVSMWANGRHIPAPKNRDRLRLLLYKVIDEHIAT